jgi:hypothetical protein
MRYLLHYYLPDIGFALSLMLVLSPNAEEELFPVQVQPDRIIFADQRSCSTLSVKSEQFLCQAPYDRGSLRAYSLLPQWKAHVRLTSLSRKPLGTGYLAQKAFPRHHMKWELCLGIQHRKKLPSIIPVNYSDLLSLILGHNADIHVVTSHAIDALPSCQAMVTIVSKLQRMEGIHGKKRVFA